MNTANELFSAGSREQCTSLLELATREVFHLMLGSELATATSDAEPPHEVTSMVGMAGELCGVLSIRCEEKAAVLMTSRMLGVPPENAKSEMQDALGEICNMVAGNFKNKIAGLGDGCMLSPPTVISGSDYTTYSIADKPAIGVCLLFESMPIMILLEIHS